MNNAMNHALSINDVKVSYGKTEVLHGISMDIAEGETFGLIGLNGAGKTTLIKSILGLRDVQFGDIHVFGHERKEMESRRRYAYLPERFDPPWFLSGMEFLRFSMKLYDAPFSDQQARDAAERLALDPAALDRRVQTYSKGMRQKLGLMGTIMTGCGLFILDEPMSGLDPRARAAVKDMLLETKAQGRTIFLSSHILSDMDEICDRVGVLHEGVLRYLGPPSGLKSQTGTDHLERAFLKLIEKPAMAA
jgi:ABC-2 type transport system ATP-binding protein